MATQQRARQSNGGAPVKLEPSAEDLAAAAEHERQIEWEAADIWAGSVSPDDDEPAVEPVLKPSETAPKVVTAEQAENLRKAVDTANLTEHLQIKLRGFGVSKIEELTVEQGMGLWEWAQGGDA
jgi:hypothetical protein